MSESTDQPLLTARFREALTLAFDLHEHQTRKGSGVPYFSHLMSVSALILEDGGDEDEAIAGLLHDALEDQGDKISADEIEARFGRRVRELVEACTDGTPVDGGKKEPWDIRKARYIEHIAQVDHAHRVSLADKLHNARSILCDLRMEGEAVWGRFSKPKEKTLGHYRALVEAFREGGAKGYLIEEKERVVRKIEEKARTPPA